MATPVEISDSADPRLADYVRLTDVALRTKLEPPRGLFVAEGDLVIRRALHAGYLPRSVLLSPRWLDSLATTGLPAETPIYLATTAVLEAVTGFHVHRGALASMRRRPLPAPGAVLATARRVAVLENVNSHPNLGAIFRCAAALGMDAVLLSPSCADPLYRRSVRVSMGEVFAVPYARFDSWRVGLRQLAAAGFQLLALTPDQTAVPLDLLELSTFDKVALLLGAEGTGLSAGTMSVIDERVRIPMSRGVDSLNVGAAAAIAFYVLTRR